MTIREALDTFIDDRTLYGLSPRTIEAYSDFIGRFVKFIGEATLVEDIQLYMIRAYIASLRDRSLSNATIATYIRHIKVFLHWVSEELEITYNLSRIRTPRVPKKNVHLYTEDEILKIFELATAETEWMTLRNKAALALMLDSGLRRNEVCNIETDRMDLELHLLDIDGKGSKSRVVPIGNTSAELIRQYLSCCPFDTSRYLFVNRYGKRFTNNAMKLMVNKLAKQLPFQLSCHRLRHNFATNYCIDMYDEKGAMDAYALQTLLGHSEFETTKRYLHQATQVIASNSSISHLDTHVNGILSSVKRSSEN